MKHIVSLSVVALTALSLCRVLVSTDSFLIDGAAALGIPTIALMGPTGARERLKHTDATILVKPRPCVPCWRGEMEHCHINRDIPLVSRCLADISVDEVMSALGGLVDEIWARTLFLSSDVHV